MITHKTNLQALDPMNERDAYVVKGLIQKFEDRVVVELTLRCAKYCEFCYRKWKVGAKSSVLTRKDIKGIGEILKKNHRINEVIISGGDPFTEPDLLVYFLRLLERIKSITVIRIHTRLPIVKPEIMSEKILKQIFKCKKPVYVSLHVNKAEELSKKAIKAITKLKRVGAILYSQSVMLSGINDSPIVLAALFEKLLAVGVRPYNIYHCNKAAGIEHFIVPLEREIEIMTEVRSKISGLAYPTLIVDAPGSAHKIPAPLSNWKCDISEFKDFAGKSHSLQEIDRI